MVENWLEETRRRLNQVLAEYDVNLSSLAAMDKNIGYAWLVRFHRRDNPDPTINRVRTLRALLDEILGE